MGREILILVSCGLVALASSPALGQPIESEGAGWFRGEVGLGPMDLAAVGIPAESHEALIDADCAEIAAQAAEDRSVIEAVSDAGQVVWRALSWGRDPVDARQDLDDAREHMLQALGTLIEESRDLLPPNLRPYVDRAVANVGLGSPYRLLDLSSAQRDAMLQLQNERDRVLLDARQRVRPERLDAARETFETQARAVLARAQQAELDQLQANIAANLDAVLDREAADDADEPTAEDEEDAGQASVRPKAVPDSMASLVAGFRRGLRAVLERLTPAGALSPIAATP